jgi:hypothetical protein
MRISGKGNKKVPPDRAALSVSAQNPILGKKKNFFEQNLTM